MATAPDRSAGRTAGSLTPGARKVLDAASRLFYERGIHAVGVDVIAAEAGVTKKTLYDRFGSKDQIVVAYLAGREERWRAFLESHLATVPSEEQVLGVFDASARWEAEYSPRGCSFVNARAELPDPDHPAFALIDEAKQFMLELFVRLAAAAGAPNPTALGPALFILHEGALVSSGLGAVADAWPRARLAAARMLAPAPTMSVAPVFPVRDLGRALAHYQRLGFAVRAYREGDEYGFADRDGVGLHLAAQPGMDPLVGAGAAYLYVPDADALAEQWSRPGIGGKTRPPSDTPYRLREGAHIDPDNNLIRFGSWLPGARPQG